MNGKVVKVLVVTQFGELKNVINSDYVGRTLLTQESVVWEDNGEAVQFPIALNEKRKRKYNWAKYKFAHTFEELCSLFPDSVVEMSEHDYSQKTPLWGTGWYTADENGFAECARDNWDTSD